MLLGVDRAYGLIFEYGMHNKINYLQRMVYTKNSLSI